MVLWLGCIEHQNMLGLFLLHVDTGLCRQCQSSEVVRLVKGQFNVPRGKRQKLASQLSRHPIMEWCYWKWNGVFSHICLSAF